MSAWAKLKPAASSTPGRTRGPANAASRAKSPRASRRASPGTTKAAGRCTRPSQGGGELGVADGGRRGHVDRPADAIGAQQEPDRGNLVRQGNPAPVLLARPEAAAEPQPEYRQHLSERPAVTSQNDPASEIDHPRTGGTRLLRRVLPRDAGVGQETGPCWPGSLGLTVCCTDPPTPSSSSSACERPCGRRDVYATTSRRWADRRARLLQGEVWEAARAGVATSLGHDLDPHRELAEFATDLDAAYRAVANRLQEKEAVRIETADGHGRLVLTPLDRLEEPPSLLALQAGVADLLPRVDLPDVLLEVAGWTGFLSDQFAGFHAIVVPGTLRDSLYILDGLLEQQTTLQPTEPMTDTAGYAVTWTFPVPSSRKRRANSPTGLLRRRPCGSCTSVARTVRTGSNSSTMRASA